MRSSLLLMLLLVTFGCANVVPVDDNTLAGRDLAGRIRLFNENDLGKGYPSTLDELRLLGGYQDLPKCKCEDGMLRNFLYIQGYPDTSPTDFVVLVSPPEMDKHRVILVYLNLTTKICSRAEAEVEIQRSRAFIKSAK
jgi:hypothetical protein